MKKNKEKEILARDLVISRAHLLPHNLFIVGNEKTQGFAVSYLLTAPSEVLQKISDLCTTDWNKGKKIELWFSHAPSSKAISRTLDVACTDFSAVQNLEVKVGSNIGEHLNYFSVPPVYYLNVTFIGPIE